MTSRPTTIRQELDNYVKKIVLLLTLLVSTSVFANNDSGWQTYGDIMRYLIPASAAVITLYERDFTGFKELAISTVTTQLITEGLKAATKERRPNGGCCASFPSGHVSASFSGASFLQRRYGWQYGILPYAAAILVGVSRIQTHAHYSHDVIAGAILAMGVNLLVTKPYTFPNKTRLLITPEVTTQHSALTMTYWF